MNHGPIDLIVKAYGDREAAYRAATDRFQSVLAELVGELPRLRAPLDGQPFTGCVARRMADAVRPHGSVFVTPMAAVAGAVADEILAAMRHAAELERAAVNNGGDIALHLGPGQSFSLAMASGTGHDLGRIAICDTDGIGGIATSGRHGRSFSLGIADSVTVLADTAAAADAAATLVANAVDLPGHPAIFRHPARDLDPDSDLGERLVTTGVGPISAMDAKRALDAGAGLAIAMLEQGLILGTALYLGNQVRAIGAVTPTLART